MKIFNPNEVCSNTDSTLNVCYSQFLMDAPTYYLHKHEIEGMPPNSWWHAWGHSMKQGILREWPGKCQDIYFFGVNWLKRIPATTPVTFSSVASFSTNCSGLSERTLAKSRVCSWGIICLQCLAQSPITRGRSHLATTGNLQLFLPNIQCLSILLPWWRDFKWHMI